LNDIDIISPHVFLYFNKDFFISKPAHIALCQRDTHMRGNRFGKRTVTISTDQFHLSSPS